jgi:hypothetical protein
MGFLKHLLFWPVTGPLYLSRFSMEKVQGVVQDELTDEDRVKEDLLDLQMRYELGEVDEEQYVQEEADLMGQLREVRRWREEFGMGTRGGLVKVAGQEEVPEGTPDRPDRPESSPRVIGGGATLEVTLDWDDDGGGA